MREFHVDDLGSAVVFCLEHWDPKEPNPPLDNQGNPLTHLNVGTGLDISIQDLSKKIAEIHLKGNMLGQRNTDGTNKKLLDISKIRSLGWKHKISLDQGIKKQY